MENKSISNHKYLLMLPPIQYHTFETRLVKTPDGVALYKLTRSKEGVFYFITGRPISCFGATLKDLEGLMRDIQEAMKLPIIDSAEILGG